MLMSALTKAPTPAPVGTTGTQAHRPAHWPLVAGTSFTRPSFTLLSTISVLEWPRANPAQIPPL